MHVQQGATGDPLVTVVADGGDVYRAAALTFMSEIACR